jgi:hypothetical protein
MCVFIKNKKSFNFRFNFKQVSEELQINKQYEEIFKEINIETTAADIEIKKSDDNIIKLKTYSKENQSTEEVNNDILTIKVTNEKCKFLCINTKISKIELYLPENYENKININNQYGDIKIENFENSNIDIIEDAGDIKIDGTNIAKINNKYGDIKIGNINKGDIKASAGDIEIINTNNIKIENKYGDVKIENINEYVNIKADCGDIKIENLNIIEDSSIEDNYGDIKINNTNAFVDAHTDLGDTKIKNNRSDVTLKIENDCGDIIVK